MEEITREDYDEYACCAWCGEEMPIGEMRKEVHLGYLCDQCRRGIASRGETLTFEE